MQQTLLCQTRTIQICDAGIAALSDLDCEEMNQRVDE